MAAVDNSIPSHVDASTTTWKPLKADMMTLIICGSCTNNPYTVADQNGNSTPTPPSRTMLPATPKKTAQEWPEEHDKELKTSTWSPNSTDLNLIKLLISTIHGGPTNQPTGLKGSATNSLLPNKLCPCSERSKLFRHHKGDGNNIRRVGLMLWLIDQSN